jgi:hypothetical protein
MCTIPETATQMSELLAGRIDIIRTIPPDQIPLIEGSGTAYEAHNSARRVH